MACTILALLSNDDRPKISSMMGGMNVHLDILFDDGTVWLACIHCTTAVTPPRDVQDCILRSEYATLSWLRRIGFPAPAAYGYGLTAEPNIAGVNYIIMDKLEASPLHWSSLSSDQRNHILHQLAETYLTLELHSFDQAGSIYPQDTIGAFADSVAYEVNDHQIQLLGPFDTLRKYLDHTIHLYLHLIEASEWAVDDPIPILTSLKNHSTVIDFIYAIRMTRAIIYLSMINLAFLEDSNELSQEEEDLAAIFESLERSDMAGCIQNGRIFHQITFLLDTGDRIDDCKAHLKGFYKFLGEQNWEWETWHSSALEMYYGDPILQLLMARV
ncbi:hypothetical protein H0H81_004980 [Sphagnurus paluster]|uniref:Aminoglycoside phosphotransferase domain-containing protein n=1 Tax=Sphagnurus paluster TaxID=117069 RepID=A0A9P7GEY1_9AGAR|nr:hypothetical protein H0H81_004980 [Sphagnurus paluster]